MHVLWHIANTFCSSCAILNWFYYINVSSSYHFLKLLLHGCIVNGQDNWGTLILRVFILEKFCCHFDWKVELEMYSMSNIATASYLLWHHTHFLCLDEKCLNLTVSCCLCIAYIICCAHTTSNKILSVCTVVRYQEFGSTLSMISYQKLQLLSRGKE